MPDLTNNLSFVIKAKDDASQVFGRVQSSYAQMRKELEKGEARGVQVDKSGSFLDRLKAQAGPRGPIKDVAELLVGGGAIAGVTFLAKTIKESADHAAELRKQFAAGQISARDMTADLVRQIPVLGTMVQMWDSIKNAIVGASREEKAQAAKDDADQRKRTFRDSLAKQQRERGALAGSIEQITQQLEDETALRGAKDDQEREVIQAQIEARKQLAEIDKLQAQVKTLSPEQQARANFALAQARTAALGGVDSAASRAEIERDEARKRKAEDDAKEQQRQQEEAQREQEKKNREVEQQLKERRQLEQDQINEARRRREEEDRAAESARTTGRATSAQAGLLTGSSTSNPINKTATNTEKTAKGIQTMVDLMKSRRAIELSPTS